MPVGGFPPMQPAPPPEPMLRPAEADRRKGNSRKAQGDRWADFNHLVDVVLGDLTRAEALVLLALFRDARDGVATVSYTSLAERAKCSYAAVKRAVSALQKRRLIARIKRGSNLTHQASSYRVNVRAMTSAPPRGSGHP